MSNRIILLLVLLKCCISVVGQNFGTDFSIPNSSDGASLPGDTYFKKEWGKTFWWIPRYGNDPRHGATCSFNENFTKTNSDIKAGLEKLEYTLSEFEKKILLLSIIIHLSLNGIHTIGTKDTNLVE